jgi:hypothetical protein
MIEFRKVHGAGNDFILVADPLDDHDWKALAKRLCVRQTGIGDALSRKQDDIPLPVLLPGDLHTQTPDAQPDREGG